MSKSYVFELFKEVLDEIENALPEHMVFVDSEPQNLKNRAATRPFFVLTPSIEDRFGNILPKAKPAYRL